VRKSVIGVPTAGGKLKPPTVSSSSAKDDAKVAFGVLIALWTVLFWPQLLGGRAFVLGDAAAFRSFSEFSRDRWLQVHERTYWNPYVFAGIDASSSLADRRPQYLPDILINAWDSVHSWMPPLWGPIFIHLLGMITMAWLVRELWNATPGTMVLAGIAWGIAPHVVVPFAFGHDAELISTALIPGVLLCIQLVCRSNKRMEAVIAGLVLAIIIAVQLLFGHPQVTVYSMLITVVFLVERLLHYRHAHGLIVVVLSILLGIAIGAAVWWPAYLYSAYSVRGGEGAAAKEIANFSFAARDIATLVWPWAVGFGGESYWGGMRQTDYPFYWGISIAGLALIGVIRGKLHRTTWVLVTLLGVAVLYAMGSNLPAFHKVIGSLPALSQFRVSVTGLIVGQLVTILLAAKGAQAVMDGTWQFRGATLKGAVVVLAAGLVFCLILFLSRESFTELALNRKPRMSSSAASIAATHAVLDLLWRLALLVVLVACSLLARRRGWPRGLVAATMMALVMIDLGSVSWPLLHRSTGPIERLNAPTISDLGRAGASDPRFRVASLDPSAFYSNRWIDWRVRSISGLHGAVPRAWDDLMSRQLLGQTAVFRALSVRFVGGENVQLNDTRDFEPLNAQGRWPSVFQLRNPLPRAFAVRQVIAMDEKRTLEAMASPRFDPSQVVFVSDWSVEGVYSWAAQDSIRWLADGPDRLALEVSSSARAFVVITDAFFPGWHASLDGTACAIHRVNHLCRGIVVPPGHHALEMVYRPEGWEAGVLVTRLAGVTWIILLVAAIVIRSAPRSFGRKAM